MLVPLLINPSSIETTILASANGSLVSLSITNPVIVADCENKKPKNNE